MNLKMKGGKVIIDGREFTGTSFNIDGNKVIVDGVQVDGELVGDINIQVFGNVESINNTSGAVTVNGDAGPVRTVSGSVSVSGSSLDINTVSGSVTAKACGNVRTVSGAINNK